MLDFQTFYEISFIVDNAIPSYKTRVVVQNIDSNKIAIVKTRTLVVIAEFQIKLLLTTSSNNYFLLKNKAMNKLDLKLNSKVVTSKYVTNNKL